MLKLFLIAIILVAVAFAGLGIRLLLDRKAEFSVGSCQAGKDGNGEQSLGCGCGGTCYPESQNSSQG